jgi:virginiamycin B lyase
MRHVEGVGPMMHRRSRPVLALITAVALGGVAGPIAVGSGAVASAIAPSQVPVPANAASDPSLNVAQSACPTADTCVAVGSYHDGDGTQQLLIETYASGQWTPAEGSLPVNANVSPEATFNGVSCLSATSCVAIGSYVDNAGDQQALVDTLANGSWIPTEAPLPANAAAVPDAQMSAVACPTPSSCVAVGSYDANGATVGQSALIETLSAGTWSPAEAPLPPDAGTGNLIGVSCPAAGSCVAVGDYGVMTTSDGLDIEDTLPLVATLASGSWTSGEGSIPAGTDTNALDAETVELFGDSCEAPGVCQAVGAFVDSRGDQLPLAETLSNGTWAAGEVPLPPDTDPQSTSATVLSVSCAPEDDCVAVGDYLAGAGNQTALVENLSGGIWSTGDASLPSFSGSIPPSVLDGVSCSPSVSCATVGTYQDNYGDMQGVFDILPVPGPVTSDPDPDPSVAGPLASVPGPVTTYAGTGILGPLAIAAGPDGALWFTNRDGNSIGRLAPSGAQSGVVTDYTDPSVAQPGGIAAGPDGALWFTNQNGGASGESGSIGRITTAGAITDFTGPGISDPRAIAAGPDGAMWFTNSAGGRDPSIGRISMSGAVTDYSTGPDAPTGGIVAGPDGDLWFTSGSSIGRMTTAGVVTMYTDPGVAAAAGIAVGPDGALWFTNQTGGSGPGSIGRISTAGVVTIYTDPAIVNPNGITAGPDGALWFTDQSGTSIGRITTAGIVTQYPGACSGGPQGIAAGPDGALWCTNTNGDAIVRMATPAGHATATSSAHETVYPADPTSPPVPGGGPPTP